MRQNGIYMHNLFLRFLKDTQNKGSLNYEAAYPLYRISTFGIGGKARYFVLPKTEEALCKTVNAAEKAGISYIVIGNASNLLFDDSGYFGAVISTVKMSGIFVTEERETEKQRLFALCGAKLPVLSWRALQYGFTGFEGLCSIPATVGGALCSNAGAFGNEISDKLEYVKVFSSEKGETFLKSPAECAFSYRSSRAADKGEIILSASFNCEKNDPSEIAEKMKLCKAKRAATQPLGMKSGGCYFKMPSEAVVKNESYKGVSAGELIDRCGLKGMSIGKAAVSDIHGNFIINTAEKGSASDVLKLAEIIKNTVYARTGIQLCEEVVFVRNPGRKV
jgi:UDP-N-acetylmuramate dehydrogenase